MLIKIERTLKIVEDVPFPKLSMLKCSHLCNCFSFRGSHTSHFVRKTGFAWTSWRL